MKKVTLTLLELKTIVEDAYDEGWEACNALDFYAPKDAYQESETKEGIDNYERELEEEDDKEA